MLAPPCWTEQGPGETSCHWAHIRESSYSALSGRFFPGSKGCPGDRTVGLPTLWPGFTIHGRSADRGAHFTPCVLLTPR